MKKLFTLLFAAALMLGASQAMAQDQNSQPEGDGPEIIVGEFIYGPAVPAPQVAKPGCDMRQIKQKLREIDLLLRYLSPNPNVAPDTIEDLVKRKMALEAQTPKHPKKPIPLERMKNSVTPPSALPAQPPFAQVMPPCSQVPQPPCPCFPPIPCSPVPNMGGPK